jgi:hypothetical protein
MALAGEVIKLIGVTFLSKKDNFFFKVLYTVKLGDKKRLDSEPFPVTNFQVI